MLLTITLGIRTRKRARRALTLAWRNFWPHLLVAIAVLLVLGIDRFI